MSNDDLPPPPDQPPGEPADIPGLPNNPVEGTPTEPTQVFPTVPPPTEPTLPPSQPQAQIPGDPVAPEMMAVDSPVSRYELPWYRQPGQLALLLFALLAVAGLVILLIVLSGGDDDGAITTGDDDPVSVVVTRLDGLGSPFDASITAVVTAPDDQYVWIVPSEAVVGEPAVRITDASGRTEFRWQPSAEADATTWTTQVELGEVVPPDVATGGVTTDCAIDRGADESPTSLSVAVAFAGDDLDPTAMRVATYSFPNVAFEPGDRVTCTLTNASVTPPTSTTTTTLPADTTTTVVDTTTTTVPPTTTTTVASTTTPPATTTPPTTTTTVPPTTTTVPPPVVQPGSVLEFLTGRSELSGFVDLINSAGLIDDFNDPDRSFTVFAPDNDAVADLINDPSAPDLTDQAVLQDLVQTHVLDGESIDLAEISGRATIAVEFGNPQPVVAGPPVTIGNSGFAESDNVLTSATVHVLDTVLQPVT